MKKELCYRSNGDMDKLALESVKKCWSECMAHAEAVHQYMEQEVQKEREFCL